MQFISTVDEHVIMATRMHTNRVQRMTAREQVKQSKLRSGFSTAN